MAATQPSEPRNRPDTVRDAQLASVPSTERRSRRWLWIAIAVVAIAAIAVIGYFVLYGGGGYSGGGGGSGGTGGGGGGGYFVFALSLEPLRRAIDRLRRAH